MSGSKTLSGRAGPRGLAAARACALLALLGVLALLAGAAGQPAGKSTVPSAGSSGALIVRAPAAVALVPAESAGAESGGRDSPGNTPPAVAAVREAQRDPLSALRAAAGAAPAQLALPDATGLLIVATLDGRLHGIDARGGKKLWTAEAGGGVVSGSGTGAASAGGAPSNGSAGGRASDGEAETADDDIWGWDDEDDVSFPAGSQVPPEDSPDAVYIAEPMGGGTLYVYQAGRAMRRLPLPIRDLVALSPFRSADGTMYIGRKSARFLAVEPKSGRVLGDYGGGDQGEGGSVCDAPGGKLVDDDGDDECQAGRDAVYVGRTGMMPARRQGAFTYDSLSQSTTSRSSRRPTPAARPSASTSPTPSTLPPPLTTSPSSSRPRSSPPATPSASCRTRAAACASRTPAPAPPPPCAWAAPPWAASPCSSCPRRRGRAGDGITSTASSRKPIRPVPSGRVRRRGCWSTRSSGSTTARCTRCRRSTLPIPRRDRLSVTGKGACRAARGTPHAWRA
ncbi:hypothetical protein DFJ74DRAFT_491868 [Hyaloraphidium curvatum]|nr:hypothetical protein DFJ74DRAFT_491868 [Hyaloraphidium curvatum]